MSESLEELKAIIENAPEGATHFDGEYWLEDERGDLKRWSMVCDVQNWYFDTFPEFNNLRSLSDIKRIFELMEHVSKLEFVIDIANRNHVTKFNIELDKENSDKLKSYLHKEGNQ